MDICVILGGRRFVSKYKIVKSVTLPHVVMKYFVTVLNCKGLACAAKKYIVHFAQHTIGIQRFCTPVAS